VRPPPMTATFMPHNKGIHWTNSYLQIKLDKMKKLFKEIKEEDDKYANRDNLPDHYIETDRNASSNCFP
jgi:hypothetical protein